MHRAQTLALLLAAGLLCSGCSSGTISSNYRPVEDLTLIQTIGVDRAPEGVCLSASTGRVGENEPPQRMTQTGETVLAALDRLQDRTPNAELFYAQTSYLLLGEEAAAAGELAPLLDFIARNPDMRLSAPLFLVRGAAAQQAVMDTGDDRTDVTEALAALQKDTALSGTSHAFSCADIARALAGSGCAAVGAVACVRTPESEGGKLALAPAGYAIFRGGDYLGCIAPETARGASMLLGVVTNGDIAVRDGDGSTVMLTLGRRHACARGRDAAAARGHLRAAHTAPDHGAGLSGRAQRGARSVRGRLGARCARGIAGAGGGLSRRGAGRRRAQRAQMGGHPRRLGGALAGRAGARDGRCRRRAHV